MTPTPPTYGRNQYERITIVVPPVVQVQLVAPPAPVAAPVAVRTPARVRLSPRQYMAIAAIAAGLLASAGGTMAIVHGCGATPTPPVINNPSPGLKGVVKTTTDTTADMGTQIGRAGNAFADISRATPPSLYGTFSGFLASGRSALDALLVDLGQFKGTIPQLNQAAVDTDRLVAANAQLAQDKIDLAKQRDAAKAERDSATNKLLTVLIVLGAIGTAGGIAALCEGDVPLGVGLIVGCTALSVTAKVYRDHMGWLIAGVSVLAVGGVAYVLVKRVGAAKLLTTVKADAAKAATATGAELSKLKTIVVPELVQSVSTVKQAMIDAKVDIVDAFGHGAKPGALDVVQSPVTQAVVKQVKASGAVRLALPTPRLVAQVAVPVTAKPAA